MFGYVTIDKPELKIKDYRRYQAYYCGLCRALKKRAGFAGRMTLTYDMTFAVILLTSLYESETCHLQGRCIVHPARKHDFLSNEITDYAADMNLLLSYYHLLDDWRDERSVRGLFGSLALKPRAMKIAALHPVQSKAITDALLKLQQYEKRQETDLDKVSGCFGRLMEALFLYRRDRWEPVLGRMGFFLGKFIYLLDAWDDLKADTKSGSYNLLKGLSQEEGYEEQCEALLTMMIAECCAEFEKLPCLLDKDILENILYSGVWAKYKRKKERKQI